MAVRVKAETQFNVPPHQSELNLAVLSRVPGYLEFIVDYQWVIQSIADLTGLILHQESMMLSERQDKNLE